MSATGFNFICPTCRNMVEAESEMRGTQAVCPACSNLIMVPVGDLEPGVVLGGFELLEKIGQGAMGAVYRTRQITMDRDVALKVLLAPLVRDTTLIKRFLTEIKILAQLEHPNIISVFDSGYENRYYYLAMAYVQGKDLQAIVTERGFLPENEVQKIALSISEALGQVWSTLKVIHRDIKPANIMLDSQNVVKLLDLGVAKSLKANLHNTAEGKGIMIGTPYYMSPEQFQASETVDFRSDIYALGMTLFHLLTGKPAFTGADFVELGTHHCNSPLPNPQDYQDNISDGFVHLLRVMTAKQQKERYQSWESVTADITRVGLGQMPEAPLPTDVEARLPAVQAKEDKKKGFFGRLFNSKGK